MTIIIIRIKENYYKKHIEGEGYFTRRCVDRIDVHTIFKFRKKKQERLEGNFYGNISDSVLIQKMMQYRLDLEYVEQICPVNFSKEKILIEHYSNKRIGIGVYLAMVMNGINEKRLYRWAGDYDRSIPYIVFL